MRLWVFVFMIVLGFAMNSYADEGRSDVSINGYWISKVQLQKFEHQLGTKIPAGHYLVNFYSGCWKNLSNNTGGCMNLNGNSGMYVGRAGSGEWNRSGDWNYYSNAAGMGVGGTANGCIYTENWSNC